jgi:hypothetical protein
VRAIDDLSLTEKSYGVVAGLAIVTVFLLLTSVQLGDPHSPCGNPVPHRAVE